ncbi:MAG: hypothetical protein P8R42_01040 [Candidatus Binatia bacterium]|nr:hypothetical protein [Candidatus Binatia bacterium]
MALLHESPGGQEIRETTRAVAADVSSGAIDAMRAFIAVALCRADRAGEIDLARAGLTAPRAAEMVLLSVHGLQGDAPAPKLFRRNLAGLVNSVAGAIPTG